MAHSFDPSQLPRQEGRVVVITGGNSGIGLEAARWLARLGADVVLACRNTTKANEAAGVIRRDVPGARLQVRELDLADLASVRAFAEAFRREHDRLDVLCNNAGVMAIPRRTTTDGFEMQLGTNHLGHFALTGLLLDRLLESAPSRIVTVSSMAHTFGRMRFDDLQSERRYHKWAAYGQSKLANLLFAFELARRLERRPEQVLSVACHPGYAATNLQHVGPQMSGSRLGQAVVRVGNAVLAQSAEAGAWPTLYAATASDVESGQLIGPSGPRHLWGPPRRHRAHPRAGDREAAARLWDRSVELTGVRYAALSPPGDPGPQG